MARTAAKVAQPSLLDDNKVLPRSPSNAPMPAVKPTRGNRPSTAIAIHEPKAPQAPKNMLTVVMQAVTDPRCDVGKMQALLDMQRSIEERDEARQFNVALLAAQSEMPKIVKDRENTHTKSKYATLEKVAVEVDHIARRHGFSQSFGTADSPLPNHYRIICDLSHTAGHVRRYFCDLENDSVGPNGARNKTAVQGGGSTMSYGRRYIKVMMFDLIIVGEDRDGNKPRIVEKHPDTVKPDDSFPGDRVAKLTQKQIDSLTDAIEACGVGRAKFLTHYEIKKLEDLPPGRYAEAIKACADFQTKNVK